MNTFSAHEFKLVSLRECPLPETLQMCDQPALAAKYWRENVTANPAFNRDAGSFIVLLLNARRRIKGHVLVSIGTLDTILRKVIPPSRCYTEALRCPRFDCTSLYFQPLNFLGGLRCAM